MFVRYRLAALLLGLVPLSAAIAHQDDDPYAGVEVTATLLRPGLYMLTGAGGNIVAGTGKDGTFLVDDQFAPLNARINAALKSVNAAPVRFIINTHWHGDHTGGNEAFAEKGVVIIAQDNVRRRMSSEQVIKALDATVPPAPDAALPVITFSDESSLHLNGDTAHIIHVEHAHTDGDSLVHFEKANVLHMGDIYFNGLYPLVDLSSGGDIDGIIAGAERGIALADDDTLIVPGHGPLSNKAGLTAYAAMLVDIRSRVAEMKDRGMSREAVIAAKPTARYDTELGSGFIPPDKLAGFVFDSI